MVATLSLLIMTFLLTGPTVPPTLRRCHGGCFSTTARFIKSLDGALRAHRGELHTVGRHHRAVSRPVATRVSPTIVLKYD